jgi:hypothetical protein
VLPPQRNGLGRIGARQRWLRASAPAQARPCRSIAMATAVDGPALLRFAGSVSSGVAGGVLLAAGVAGWRYPPQEEVPVSSSCSMQGLLIAENAG